MKIQAVDISQGASAATIVFEALREAIINGDLNDGDALRQDEVAEMFKTSRIPVREAIAMLEHHGLVKSQRYKGAVVASLSAEEAEEIFDFRALVEGRVIEVAVPKMDRAVLSKARACLNAFSTASDPMVWGRLNREFHYTLYQASAMEYHLAVVQNALDRVDRYLRAQLVLSNGMQRASEEHLEILKACEQGQVEVAGHLTRQHILGAKAVLLRHLSARPAQP